VRLSAAERDAIADAARRYVAAYHAVENVPRDMGPHAEYAAALHALLVAVDRSCAWCDPGTCPLAPVVVDVLPSL
jgi:hypothetical protein